MLELRHILRRLARSPMFAAITLLTLALGIGANVAIFSIINGILLKPLPYPDADRLVGVWMTAPGVGIKDVNASPSSYFTFREENRTFEEIGLWSRGSDSVTGLAEPEEVPSFQVTHGFLPTIRVQPVLGRGFTLEDDTFKNPKTVILGHGYWKRRFGGEKSAIGSNLIVNGEPREIIGVLPENFELMSLQPALVLPFQFNRAELRLGNFSFQAIARLKPGVTLADANADVGRMISLMYEKFPPPPGMTAKQFQEAGITPNLRFFHQDVVGDVGKALWVVMATVGIVLLIACANVGNLMLVRADGRQQELAVRAALGAGWRQIARDLLLESLALGVAGGILGLAVAYGALRLLLYLNPSHLPRLNEIAIDPPVIVFALLVSLAAGLLFGLIPVLKYARPGLANALRSGGRTHSGGRERHRTRNVLVVVQVALALVLLIGSGLMIRTMQALHGVDPGFRRPEQILTLRLFIPEAQVKEPKRVARMHQDIADKIAAISGVESVAMSNSITMDGMKNMDPIFAEDRVYADSKIPPVRTFKHLSPGYFATMGNPMLAGRDFSWTDIHEMRPVAIVSNSLARELWGRPEAALGKRIRENPKGVWREVVGVAGDERDDGVHRKVPAIVYWPMMKANFWGEDIDLRRTLAFAIRSPRAESSSFIEEVRQAVWSVNPNLPLSNVRTVRELYDRSLARTTFTLVLLSIAAGMALLLGVIGIYGVISYSVAQRTREIGIRMAVGATANSIRGLFVRYGLTLSAIGLGAGFAAAFPLSSLMTSLLYEVKPADPVTYVSVGVVLLAAALAAAYFPARRATKVAPLDALRME
jgi:putative ABC transport system permease protein